MVTQSKYQAFKATYQYKELMQKHSLGDRGIWQVTGEDENCDLGGSHYHPILGFFEGKLQDIVEYAVEMNKFWTWGAGGDIKKIEVAKINYGDSEKLIKMREEREKLMARLDEINKEIGQ